jgi:hypothetical protein
MGGWVGGWRRLEGAVWQHERIGPQKPATGAHAGQGRHSPNQERVLAGRGRRRGSRADGPGAGGLTDGFLFISFTSAAHSNSPMYTGSRLCVPFSFSSTTWPYFSVARTLQADRRAKGRAGGGAGAGAGGKEG